MVTLNETDYELRAKDFAREHNRITPYKSGRPLTANLELRQDYKECLVRTYNAILDVIQPIFKNLSVENQIDAQNKLTGHLTKLKEAFYFLNLKYEFERNAFSKIDIDKITEDSENDTIEDIVENIIEDIDSDTASESESSESSTDTTIDTTINHSHTSHLNNTYPNNQNLNMVQTAAEFIRTAYQMINTKYSGEPSGRDSFIDAIELLKELCEPQNNQTFVKFVMTRLEGKARQLIGDTPANVDIIIERLRAGIKRESSKVIEGRILALRADKTSLLKFAEQAEKLADRLNESLCVEGFSQEKAKEITIEKTVEMCRKSAKNDTVKAVLAASAFSEPKEVIAKMIVEINNLKQDKPHTSYTHKVGNQSRNHFGNTNRNQGQSQSGYQNNRNSNRNGQHHNNNRQNNNNGSNGRSNFRNGQNYHGNSNNRGNYNNHSQQGNNNQTIRHISGNEVNPGNSGITLNQQQQQQ